MKRRSLLAGAIGAVFAPVVPASPARVLRGKTPHVYILDELAWFNPWHSEGTVSGRMVSSQENLSQIPKSGQVLAYCEHHHKCRWVTV